MANTSSHPVTVNGNRLDTWARNIKVKDGWVQIPARRGKNVPVPGAHGELWVPNKRYEMGSMLLDMWVRDTDADNVTTNPTNRYAAWRQNLDALLQLFNSSYALLDVRVQFSATDIRQAFAEVKAISDPVMRGDTYGELKVSLDIPGTFWRTPTQVQFASPTGASAAATHTLIGFAGATAPIEDAQFLVEGPITNPKITDPVTGHYVQLAKVLAAGEAWMLDSGAWSSKTGATATVQWNTTGGISQIPLTTAVGPFLPAYMGLAPGSSVVVQLSGTGTGTGTKLSVRGYRKFI